MYPARHSDTYTPPAERERQLKRPGETWISLDEWLAMDRTGWRIIEAIWHGQDGSRREEWGGVPPNMPAKYAHHGN